MSFYIFMKYAVSVGWLLYKSNLCDTKYFLYIVLCGLLKFNMWLKKKTTTCYDFFMTFSYFNYINKL